MITGVIIGGIVINIITLIVYYTLKRRIERFSTIDEKIIITTRRSRASYFLAYILMALVIISLLYFNTVIKLMLIFLCITIVLLIDTHHNSMRLVLTQNQIIYVQGFLNIKSKSLEYRDVILIEVSDYVIGGILGYGDVNLTIVGGKTFSFKKITKYMEVKDIIEHSRTRQEGGK